MQRPLSTAIALHLNGQREQAEALYRAISKRDPDYAQATHLLGRLLRERNELPKAVALMRQAVALNPGQAAFHGSLGEALQASGDLGAAISAYEQALSLEPHLFEARYNLGLAWRQMADVEQALACFGRAAALQPGHVDSHYQQGLALTDLRRFAEAAGCFQRVLQLQPEHPAALQMLGAVLLATGHAAEAVAPLQRAVALQPDFAAWNNLGGALMRLGRVADAAAPFRAALDLQPGFAAGYSNLLFCLMHDASVTPEDRWAQHQGYAERYEAPLRPGWPVHRNPRQAGRRLRLGFVSGDLRNHAVAHFIEPVLDGLDAQQFDVFVYASHPAEDAVTQRLRARVPQWLQVHALSDEALAARIAADAIDILIDLSGHTAHNRLLAFARKPAPLQATWIGYPGTTGLAAMDYVICDPCNAPQGLYERYCSEKFARLPSAVAFSPAPAPDVAALPALQAGHVCFGSFNRPGKLSDAVIAVWSQVLHAVPQSRLTLGYVSNDETAQRLLDAFARCGIAAERIDFKPEASLQDYLALHAGIDILLDAWPYSGGTTNHHAVWMGVPVVSLRGPSRAHCQGAAVMARLGLADWVADDPQRYVAIAVAKAGDLQALADLRRGLRARWRDAPLRQNQTVVDGLQLALRGMWAHWCAGLAPADFEVTLDDIRNASRPH